MSGSSESAASQVLDKASPVHHKLTSSKYERAIELRGWTISTAKYPISNSKEIDEDSEKLTIPLPEMIFGNNAVTLSQPESGITLNWTSFDALDTVNKNGTDLKVSYSDSWNKSRDDHSEEIKHVTKPFDWTYTPSYRGSLPSDSAWKWEETDQLLPMELLKRQDPILFYDEVILYESELDDNGTSVLSVRVRVMPDRLLILARFFMRLDNVVFRVRDTRLYVEFETGVVLREYLVREEKYDTVKARIKPYQIDEVGTLVNDANWVAEQCPVVDGKMETLKHHV
ncbi:putative TOR signalling pathway protein TipA [Taphrina deformans PYCC 5710]|uniref:TOR signalling pathway protein TipA n=1 Tax=Taphrina deformans (strain PYCC 5710 / ATCC 11124 / CBS 356.35 / IMI 108563 / JCM 9778 / NBRC 8474) TaxID=1097556 RepID=R4X6J2_TAPDE|nr:putative TOR signalling pathway protein TipA [Taphrina deformans PYCC 5710]|eukprot:CCG80759.1 putative TOR signalling pathway protein TipA [Taphrina deformans PYCC 5710]